MAGLESEDTRDFASSAEAGGASGAHGPSRFRPRLRNGLSVSGGGGKKKGGKGKSATTRVGDLKTKSEILKKRSIKQAQERRRVKRKAAAVKGQSTKRRKGQTR